MVPSIMWEQGHSNLSNPLGELTDPAINYEGSPRVVIAIICTCDLAKLNATCS